MVRGLPIELSIGCTRTIVALAKSDAHRYQAPRVPPSTTPQHNRHAFTCASPRRAACPPRRGGFLRSLGLHGLRLAKLMRQAGRTAAAEFTNPSNDLTAVEAAPRREPIQPPARFEADPGRLSNFFGCCRRYRYAFEFRQPSW